MWLKIFSIIGLCLQVFFQILQTLSQAKEEQEGKLEQNADNQKIIEDKVDEANKTRADAAQLDDNLLLPPAERSAGGLPGIPADLRGKSSGGIETKSIDSSGKNQGAQFYMGKELPAYVFIIPERKITKVFIHCSASDKPEDDNVKTINEWHIARGWTGIGYNYYIDKKGRLWTGRDIETIPAAQAGHNTGAMAICLGGLNYFTAAQFLSLQEFCKSINRAYQGKITFHGHCEVSSKTCPDFDYKSVLGLDDKGNIKQ